MRLKIFAFVLGVIAFFGLGVAYGELTRPSISVDSADCVSAGDGVANCTLDFTVQVPLPSVTPASTPSPTSTPTVTPTAEPTATPEPQPGRPADLPTDDTFIEEIVDLTVDREDWLKPAWGDGRLPNQTNNGNFRTGCAFSHFGNDDPIVLPGQAGASHLHMFFGNTNVNAGSTYESLRLSGDSTCDGGPLNRTAYWTPALLDENDTPVAPTSIEVYYKTPKNFDELLVEIPSGLRFVGGFDQLNQWDADPWFWTCRGSNRDTRGSAIPDCQTALGDNRLDVWVAMPMCWDGMRLWSNDRSHMSYEVWTNTSGQWRSQCPNTHPVRIPTITVIQKWDLGSDTSTADWRISSDHEGVEPGSTMHADWFGAWDPETIGTWHSHCILMELNCSGSVLGDGTQLERAQ